MIAYDTATGGNAAVTITPPANGRVSIHGVQWSHAEAPASTTTLTIAGASAGTIVVHGITAAGPGFLPFDGFIQTEIDDAITVTLTDAGSGANYLSVTYEA